MDKVLIHRYAKFQKTMEILRRSGGKGARAVNRAEEVMKELLSGNLSSLTALEKRTKHGEQRIDNCIKYDLGGGYRLVSVKYKGFLIVTFLGSHDECDRWIENNRGFETDVSLECKRADSFFEILKSREKNPFEKKICVEDDYDDILMKKVDEKMLKILFSGFYKD
jgi:hypothetical protein